MINSFEQRNRVTVAAHRGFSSMYPENTLLAFKESLEKGVNMIEFDLRLSRDKVVMILHDETLDRTTNGTGPITDLTLRELKQLDAGSWLGNEYEGLKIPTLEELCELLKDYPDTLLNVEIKKSPIAKEVMDKAVSILSGYGYLSKCVFTCFDADIISYIYDKYHLKTQGFPAEKMSNFTDGENGTYSKMWSIAFSMDLLTKEKVDEFKDKELHVWCYCPDTCQAVQYALDCGVSLITCNNIIPAITAISGDR
ncbi:glycerophosphodiester phosphodiesterase [Gracilibacillus oryzae]|uniref:Glycerophosphodiester phosphodiesterase n=1 Tax=Gracilibacillus oryzae TaxID=1672701 RepID=A0A7C8L422_9BACI|nr:glycerophosphodiester phosphodiesterase family protein [Gracilibacillus oryzae]KAB8137530.1 glycerophosphodiester phosphodiesterase [Gracilibacillus oryzae]